MGDDNYSPLLHPRDAAGGGGGGSSSYDMNTKILLSAIISLSLVVILVIILHIYARFLMRRQARRESALRRLSFIISAAHHRASIDPQNNAGGGGLSPSIIASLPLHVHRREGSSTAGDSTRECSVCLSAYEDGEKVRVLPNCKHGFHAECIDTWLGSNSTCPVCRTEAEPAPAVVVSGGAPSAPPLEGTTSGGENKVGRSVSSRLGYSFRRMLSRERSSRRIQAAVEPSVDLESGGVRMDEDQRPSP